MKELTDYNHVWLYAKHHYVRSDNILRDLAVILAKRCGLEVEYFERNPSDILQQLLPLGLIAVNLSGNPEYTFGQLFLNSLPENNWRVGGYGAESHLVRITRAILSALSITQVRTNTGEWILNIGEADPSILPLGSFS
jgi:hypothetical protein